ncbi:hypothetical protein L226DRAFT_542957 [Lentinus tigrinus ALCF2SS1-7]|uniref:DUF3074 domain-containing protein n=1 Tax=Lentinus tigrinus ALCF2SS1-6 TaxID=1328759 RepID=A0A5C2SSK9_9APHY|nr:hypothetical protein L227DRAFT_597603 [Lentinus tigrinus ALCF2SS1-6]RPD80348.1 hypothetical protein L226DRAFT_542957 [Lentinus tigrinus ALCF2SS1-7]
MSESALHLSITPLKISEIPAEDVIIKAGQEVLDSTATWKQGKTYQKNTVKTFHRSKGPKDGAAWYARVSEHTKEDATFDEFWSKLGVNKAENELQFIPDIKKVKLIKRISPTQSVWTLYYHFPPPVSPRVFTVVQTTWLSEATPRTGIIVSIPVDVTEDAEYAKLEEKGVKGRYVSVERLQELDDGKVEWRMATSSTPGGNIPQFVADSSMASTISHDVTHFLAWLHKNRSAEPAAPSSETADGHAAAPQEEAAPNAAGATA